MRLRLLHLVFMSTGALLLFKGIGIVSETGFVLSPALEAYAQDSGATPAPAADAGVGPSTEQPADPAMGATSDAQPMGEQPELPTLPDNPIGDAQGLGNGGLPADGKIQPADLGRSRSERVVLERLRERRKELDARDARQQLREDLLKAAEQRIEQRVSELKDLEERIGAAVDEKKKKEEEEFKNLARMYESMRAKDAARIFDRLDLTILVKVAKAMKPAKVADVMAKMSPDAAERLTVQLATGEAPVPDMAVGELPKIQGN